MNAVPQKTRTQEGINKQTYQRLSMMDKPTNGRTGAETRPGSENKRMSE